MTKQTNPHTLYTRKRARAVAYGTWEPSFIPADHVIAHLTELLESGRSRRWIARTAGVSDTVVIRLVSGKAKKISRHNEAKLLAVSHAHKPTGRTYMSVTGARRRIEALGTRGHSHAVIAEMAGLRETTVWNVASLPKRVAADTHHAIARVYEQLKGRDRSDATGARVKARARRLGFAPPEAWDRYTIDDPGANPRQTTAA